MRKFNVTVNGQTYEVEVEEVGGAPSAAPVRAAAPVAAPAAAPAAAAPAAPKAAAPVAGGTPIKAPMPGTILDVKVKVGDAVKAGQCLCVLEAMKMENEIPAAKDGTVAQIIAAKGASVNAGDTLIVLS
ncbi:MAG: biotin/lipoyl-binding protein [Christensenellaceae bacterium]|nr:biotin/lipoyl-binding protein [Christensenellaceae bacterium]